MCLVKGEDVTRWREQRHLPRLQERGGREKGCNVQDRTKSSLENPGAFERPLQLCPGAFLEQFCLVLGTEPRVN